MSATIAFSLEEIFHPVVPSHRWHGLGNKQITNTEKAKKREESDEKVKEWLLSKLGIVLNLQGAEIF